jgi:hypothetical protein
MIMFGGRKKSGIVASVAVSVLLGGAFAVSTHNEGSTPTTGKASASQPAPAATATPDSSVPATGTPEEVQTVIAGILAQVTAAPGGTGTTKPMTSEQVQALVREQLKQLGINL